MENCLLIHFMNYLCIEVVDATKNTQDKFVSFPFAMSNKQDAVNSSVIDSSHCQNMSSGVKSMYRHWTEFLK